MIAFALLISGIALAVAVFAGRGSRNWGRHLIVAVILALVSLPLGVFITLVLLPFWRWLEASYAIESVGHSGPAGWCYLVSILVCLLALSSSYLVSVVRGGSAAKR